MSLYDENVAARGEIQALADARKRLADSVANVSQSVVVSHYRTETIEGIEFRVRVLPKGKVSRPNNRLQDRAIRRSNVSAGAYEMKRRERSKANR